MVLSLSDSSPEALSVSEALSVFSLSASSWLALATVMGLLDFWVFFLDSTITADTGLRLLAFRLAFSAFYKDRDKRYTCIGV